MGKKLLIAILLNMVLLSSGAFAQDRSLPYVDVEKAGSTIETLKAENQKLLADNDRLSKEIVDLSAKNDESYQTIRKIEPIYQSVSSKAKELYSVNSTIVDEKMKAKAGEAIKKNREIQNSLEDRRLKLQKQIEANDKVIETARVQTNINSALTAKNSDTIVLLEASVAKTRNQLQTMEAYIQSVNTFLAEAEKLTRQ